MVRPVGWRYESARHALSAKGIKTKYQRKFPWLVKGFKGENPRITGAYARFRQKVPKEFDKGSFRTVDRKDRKLILGTIDGESALQSVMLKRKKYWVEKGLTDEEQKLWNERRNLFEELGELKRVSDINGWTGQAQNDYAELLRALLENEWRLDKLAADRESGQSTYMAEKSEKTEKELWDERQVLIRSRNEVLAEMERNPSVYLTNKLREVQMALDENATILDIGKDEPGFFAKRGFIDPGEARKGHVQRGLRETAEAREPLQVELMTPGEIEEALKEIGEEDERGKAEAEARRKREEEEPIVPHFSFTGSILEGVRGRPIGGMLKSRRTYARKVLKKGKIRVTGRTERDIYKALERPKFKTPEERR